MVIIVFVLVHFRRVHMIIIIKMIIIIRLMPDKDTSPSIGFVVNFWYGRRAENY